MLLQTLSATTNACAFISKRGLSEWGFYIASHQNPNLVKIIGKKKPTTLTESYLKASTDRNQLKSTKHGSTYWGAEKKRGQEEVVWEVIAESEWH